MSVLDTKTIDDAKVPSIEAKLPRGYLLQDSDGVHVLGTAILREMSGLEEDIIADDKVSFTKRMHRLVGSCLTSLSDDEGHSIVDRSALIKAAPQMLMSDLLVCALRIREVTVGDELRQIVKCPNCTTDDGQPFSWTVRLSLSDFKALPAEGDLTKAVREYTTSRGTRITWAMMTGDMELTHEKKKTSKNKATAALLIRVQTVNDEPATIENLQALSYKERVEIRKLFDQEGGIETEFDVICRECEHEFRVLLAIGGVNFFAPSETSED